MELLSNRNLSEIIKKMLLCVFALGGFVSADLAYAQSDLPRLSFGVNQSYVNFSDMNDMNRACWWPDNQIWTPPQRSGTTGPQQEILVPVFIENRWRNFNNVADVVFQEISSFSFRVYYDERVLQFLDVQKHHPFDSAEAINLYSTHFYGPNIPYYQPLAKNFELVAADNKVNDYYKYFDVNNTTYDVADGNRIGSAVTITGTASSFHNLETTNPNETKVLLYLKFKVQPVENASGQTRLCPIYFDPTYIEYNGINITQDRGDKLLESMPFQGDANYNNFQGMFRNWAAIRYTNDNMKYLDKTWLEDKKNAEVFQKSIGLWNSHYNYLSDKYNTNPYLPGSITVRVMSQFPKFRFRAADYVTTIPTPELTITQDVTDSSLWIMTEPITADIVNNGGNTAYNNKSERAIIVSAEGDNPYNVMENIIVETDQPWLKIRTTSRRTTLTAPVDKFLTVGQDRRRAFAQRINNLISIDNSHNPLSDMATSTMPGQFVIWIDCDQTLAVPAGDEIDTHGEYIGHITFRSAFDKFEKTTIQVKFVVLANPIEKNSGLTVTSNVITPNGIILELTPFNGTRPELTRKLIMGSSPYALDKVDSLFGEFARQQPIGSDVNGQNLTFDARFFLDSNVYTLNEFIAKSTKHLLAVTNEDTIRLTNEWNSLTRNGFGDYSHLDGQYNNNYETEYHNARSHSRDIRSSLPSDKSNTHYVRYRFDDAGTDFYPVILKWDARTFPANNTIQLKYMNNGVLETRDMKNGGTSIGNNMYTFAFTDKGVEEFWIEYTVGQTSNDDPLVDNFGEDIIQANAWNFVSLPLDPVNRQYKYTFPNCINVPYWFYVSAWTTTVNGELQPGLGYFVKYLNLVDKKFYGSYFDYLDSNNYKIRLYAAQGAQGQEMQGWNAIGGLSKVVSTNSVSFTQYATVTLADIEFTRTHGFWAYQPKKGYKQVDRLYPGKGYFIKVNSEAYLRIDGRNKSTFELPTATTSKTAGFDQITVADANQNVANIYTANNIDKNGFELPPLPPTDMFDVRFSQNNYAANYNNEHNLVKMQGIKYPVSINFNNPTANYTVVDPVTNEIYGTVKAGTNNNIILNSARGNVFKLIAEATDNTLFVSVNNNPVNTNNAEITFGLNSNANVSIAIYNTLGNEVSKVNFGYMNAGVHNHNFNIHNLATGVYTVRMIADNQIRTFMMNVVK